MANTRQLAYDILTEIERGGYSHLLLKKMLPAELSAQDRAFVSALVYGVTERQITLDYQLGKFISAAKTSKKVLILLRMGAYQVYFMQVPDFAAVNETVSLAKRLKLNHSFVNGVMRNLLRHTLELPQGENEYDLEAVSIRYSMPMELLKIWKRDYGLKVACDLAKHVQTPYTGLRVADEANCQVLEEKLSHLGASCEGGIFRDALRVKGLKQTDNEAYRRGEFTVQGEGAMLGARAALPCGERILDMCAAPGGKSIYLAQLKPDATVTAWDLHPHRVDLIRANAKRMGVSNVSASRWDGTVYREDCEAAFDCVMVDAPCSSLGTIWQKPEIRYRVNEQTVDSLTGVQAALLDRAAAYVAPGGVIVYCTCTLSQRENEGAVKAFLERHPNFTKEAITGLPEGLGRNGSVTLFPYLFDTEGFYAARLRREE